MVFCRCYEHWLILVERNIYRYFAIPSKELNMKCDIFPCDNPAIIWMPEDEKRYHEIYKKRVFMTDNNFPVAVKNYGLKDATDFNIAFFLRRKERFYIYEEL